MLDLTAYTHAGRNVICNWGDPESGTVQFLDAFGNIIGTLAFSGIEKVIACFAAGAMIATNCGEVAVERLRPGTRVLTRDSGFCEAVWARARHLSLADLLAHLTLRPVKFAKGALGQGLPKRDTMVSPQHRMRWSGPRAELLFGETEVLIAAIHLAGQVGITQVCPAEGVSYHHLLFEQHEIVTADGAWSESFQPGSATLNGLENDKRDEILALSPELAVNPAGYRAARQTLKRRDA